MLFAIRTATSPKPEAPKVVVLPFGGVNSKSMIMNQLLAPSMGRISVRRTSVS